MDVSIYKKVGDEKIPGLKQFSMNTQFDPLETTNKISRDPVSYLQDDPSMQPIPLEDIIKGFHYGKQLVPISKTMEAEMEYTTPKEMKLLGFTEQMHVPRQVFMGPVDMVLPSDGSRNEKCFYALLSACLELKKCIIARFVYREKKANPKLSCLWPAQGANYQCFWRVDLPTAESIREYQFNSLKESTVQ
jgi:ATP-dependent DNA helicase 2 subunit 2